MAPGLHLNSWVLELVGGYVMRMAGVGGLALAILVFAGGCASLTGRPLSRYVDDKAISAKVRVKLASRLNVATLMRVDVDTYEGTVYLSGVAETNEMKARVERLAATVDDVQQVVNNLSVKRGGSAVGASGDPADAVAASPGWVDSLHGVTEQFRGIQRYQADGGPAGPYSGYDVNGRLVATLYLVPMRELAQKGTEDFRSGTRHIDHVSIYAVGVQPDVPEARYAILLWHVSPAEAAALR